MAGRGNTIHIHAQMRQDVLISDVFLIGTFFKPLDNFTGHYLEFAILISSSFTLLWSCMVVFSIEKEQKPAHRVKYWYSSICKMQASTSSLDKRLR